MKLDKTHIQYTEEEEVEAEEEEERNALTFVKREKQILLHAHK